MTSRKPIAGKTSAAGSAAGSSSTAGDGNAPSAADVGSGQDDAARPDGSDGSDTLDKSDEAELEQAVDDSTADRSNSATRRNRQPLVIVGIGASAGGLDAFKSFFAHMPAGNGLAFVLVQHLAPDRGSMLVDLLGRSTAMAVVEAADGATVQAGHVYVIPPDATLTIADGALQLTKPAPPRQYRWPIDSFFSSLGEDQGDCAVAVVLSGSGSDGARGLRAVKEHGGLTLAQAGYDHVAMTGMPASATATGLVDDVLKVEEMPARLLAHKRFLGEVDHRKGPDGARQDMGAHLKAITGLLHAEVGHDFSQYKEKTLVRRIQRRMQVTQSTTVEDYIARLKKDPHEAENLFRELLIGVTEFFRDPEAFQALHDKVVPMLLAGKGAADTLRVWISGCATGEEAYSIAMLLMESLSAQRAAPKLQVFATDIDEHAIQAARDGRYRKPLPGMSPARMERWFREDGDDLCIVKPLRDVVVFSPHSAIKDPPFSRMDLISCRNLLIYMNADLQERLIRTFHYGLKPGGFLMLGPSEGLTRNAQSFSVVDKKHRLYRRRGDSLPRLPPLPRQREVPDAGHHASLPIPPGAEDHIDRSARRALERYAPAYVVIARNHEVLRVAGDITPYLRLSSGAASLDLFDLLDKGLRAAARVAVQRAFDEQRTQVQTGLSVVVEGRRRPLRLVVQLLPGDDRAPLCVVAFSESTPEAMAESAQANVEHVAGGAADGAGDRQRIRELERELESTQTQLDTAVDQLETLNEEMKSANEEYQSVNEELQSSNEELETSKEEMQSINEELQTINAELQGKNDTLAHLNSDLQNLLDSTRIAVLFLDTRLHVTNFTPAVSELFHLRANDIGRPITEITSRIDYPQMRDDVKHVLRSLEVVERELANPAAGAAYLLRMRPYRTIDNLIDGVVLTFVDITERQQYQFDRGRLAAIVESSKDAIIGHGLDGTISSWNEAAESMFGYSAGEMVGRSLNRLLTDTGAGTIPALMKVCADEKRATESDVTIRRRDGGEIEVALTCSPVRNDGGDVIAGSTIARDLRQRNQDVQHMQLMIRELDHRVKNTLANVQAIATQTLAGSSTLDAFREAFTARLMALSQTHNQLAADAWNGADLHGIVAAVLAPYRSDEGVRIEGEPVQLNPKSALALGMALHELATNAVKYGALSVQEGRVRVSWETMQRGDESWLRIRWVEIGGPAVESPTRSGFGSRLVTRGLAYELDGEVSLDFDSAGVTCVIDLPLLPARETE